jgi:hypothetical protein
MAQEHHVVVKADAVTADEATKAVGCRYFGLTFRETAGSTGSVVVYDNASAASGTILDSVGLAANAHANTWYGPQGITAVNGIYVDITGTLQGSVRVANGV